LLGILVALGAGGLTIDRRNPLPAAVIVRGGAFGAAVQFIHDDHQRILPRIAHSPDDGGTGPIPTGTTK
jgi:hypothetical protein